MFCIECVIGGQSEPEGTQLSLNDNSRLLIAHSCGATFRNEDGKWDGEEFFCYSNQEVLQNLLE